MNAFLVLRSIDAYVQCPKNSHSAFFWYYRDIALIFSDFYWICPNMQIRQTLAGAFTLPLVKTLVDTV
jgi:hypothetical protein